MADYVKWIREKVGHENIFLNAAAAVIVNKNGEILLQRRGDFNKWGLLGGMMELGESAEETIIREVKEESGIDIKVEKLIGVYTKYVTEYPNGDKAQTVGIYFECSIINDNGMKGYDKNETLELRFFKKDELPELFIQKQQDVINDFLNGNYGCYR